MTAVAPIASNFVTLGIENEIFGVDVRHVTEILDYRLPARLPQAPVFLVGVIDVRGITVPVVDLRLKLGLGPSTVTENTRVLVLEIRMGERTVTLGLMVDRVYEVVEFRLGDLDGAPDVGVRWKSEYIRGIGRLHDSFVIVFDMERLFSTDEVASLQNLD